MDHIDIERTRKAIDNVHERWQEQRPAAVSDLMPLLAASRALVELLTEGDRLMEVTDKNAPVLSDGQYLPPGRYLVVPAPNEGEQK